MQYEFYYKKINNNNILYYSNMNMLNKIKNKAIALYFSKNSLSNKLHSVISSKQFCISLKRDIWEDINSTSDLQNFYEKLNPSETKKFMENTSLLQEKLTKKYQTKIKFFHFQKNNMHRYNINLISQNKSLTIKGDFSDKKQKAKKIVLSKLIELLNEKKILSAINTNFKFSNFLDEFLQAIIEKNEDRIQVLFNKVKFEDAQFQIENIDALYNALLFSLNLEICEKISTLIKSLKIQDSQFISTEEEEYYRTQRFLLFLETLESIISSIEKNSDYTESEVEIIKSEKDIFIVTPINNIDKNQLLPDSKISDNKDYDLIAKEDYILITYKDSEEKILGEVLSIDTDNRIKIRCPKNFAPKGIKNQKNEDTVNKNTIKIRKITSSVTFDVYSRNLRIFTTNPNSCDEKIRKMIVGKYSQNEKSSLDFNQMAMEKVFKLNFSDYKFDNEMLTEAQKSAIRSAIENRLTLIQGPPGTGKTKTAAEIVREWLKVNSSSIPILVTADSNIAVDNIFNELKKIGIKALRIGSNSNARSFFSETHNKKNIFGIIKKEITNVEVICATLVGSNSQILEKLKFERVILDEAAQSTEISNLAALNKNIKQLVIIGDHKQLRPTIQSTLAAQLGYGISLFEKLVNKEIPVQFLDTQYRMHPGISEFPSFHFYNNQIKTGISKEKRPIIPGFSWPNSEIPVAFVNLTESYEARRGNSYLNLHECERILDIIETIQISPYDLGIITPYEAQKNYLKEMLYKQMRKFQRKGRYTIGNSSYTVDTVDGFQGMEKELIIFSSVRSNVNKNMGFLKDPRRLNVMLTRAKRGLIVVGNHDTLVSDYNWKEWINWCCKNNLII